MSTNLPHRLDRTIDIEARPETVFSFFTDSDRWASWWGTGSTIDPRTGGQVYIRHPGGVETIGEVLEVVPHELIVFTYGFATGDPIPPGSSRVAIRLEPAGFGTRLHLAHEFAEPKVRDEHVQGWRYQLSVFGNVVSNVSNAHAGDAVDDWFAAWSEPDDVERERMLSRIASPDLRFRDRFGLLNGIGDLVPHIGAAQRFMPDMHLKRAGDVQHCQGTVLADWVATGSDGQMRAGGITVFTLRGDGLIETVVGFWAPQSR
jgi:uncharacterized protein YndB with AHSA1/START domain